MVYASSHSIADMFVPCWKHTSHYCPPTRKGIPGVKGIHKLLKSTIDVGWMSTAIISTKEASSFLHLGKSLAQKKLEAVGSMG